MSGRKQFDEGEALDAALRVFWARGYDAASLSELEAATGLNKSSLYNAFDSKEALFKRCLERYGQIYGEAMLAALEAPDFGDALEGIFETMLARFSDAQTPSGCLTTVATIDAGGGEAASTAIERMRAAFEARCRRAQSDGQLDAAVDCVALAAALTAVARGLTVIDRAADGDASMQAKHRATVRAAVRGVLSLIRPALVADPNGNTAR